MNKQTAVTNIDPSLMYSERWEVDHLCNRFGLSRAAAREIVDGNWGDRVRMEQEAERLAIYEKLYRYRDSRERVVMP
jgi:hypothetical protein